MSTENNQIQITLKRGLVWANQTMSSQLQNKNNELNSSLEMIKKIYQVHLDIFGALKIQYMCDGGSINLVSAQDFGSEAISEFKGYKETNCREEYQEEIDETIKKIALNQSLINSCQSIIANASYEINQLESQKVAKSKSGVK